MKTKKLIISALFLALATILSLLKLFELPFGGTITIASMVPIVLISYIYGIKWGLFSAFIYSLLQLVCGLGTGIISKMFLPGEGQMLLWQAILICVFDYIFANLSLGIGGILKGKLKSATFEIVLGSIIATSLCFLMHTISGFIFYGSWAEWFFSDSTGLSQIAFTKPFCNWVMANISGSFLALFYSVIYNAAYMIPEMIITATVSPIVFHTIRSSKIL